MTDSKGTAKWWMLAIIAVAFGVLTIKSGGAVLFFEGEAREAAGDYVPFVLWFNFVAGFAYVAAGVGFATRWSCAPRLAVLITVATLAVFAAFGIHVINGGAFEMRTVAAMSLRSFVWLTIAVLAWRWVKLSSAQQPRS
ncbi:MAG: hypothetical protein OQK54_05135 [Gammaproteobacteria bacterium]|nr:hypothetical protein [Gammaproteobacteria bacterium]MCW9088897.1 hypothetical protein [Gammaproteobacteria bacterium]